MGDGAPMLAGYGAAVLAGSFVLRRAAAGRRRRASPEAFTGRLWASLADVGAWLGVVVMAAASGLLERAGVLALAALGLAVLAGLHSRLSSPPRRDGG